MNNSPHTPPTLTRPVSSTDYSYTHSALLRSMPPDLPSPVSSTNSPHTPPAFLMSVPPDLPSPVSSTNSPHTHSAFLRSVPPDLPSPVSSTNSPHTHSAFLRPAAPDLLGPLSSTNPPHTPSDIPKFESSIDYPYAPSPRIPPPQQQVTRASPPRPRLVIDSSYLSGDREESSLELYRLSLPSAPTNYTNFSSQAPSPTESPIQYSATRENHPPFSPLRHFKRLFKRKDSPLQSSPTSNARRNDDHSQRFTEPCNSPDEEMPGSPRPAPDD